MTIGQSMLPEFDQEMQNTRKSSGAHSRRQMELEAPRQVRHGRLVCRTHRHAARVDHHDDQHRGTRLRAGREAVPFQPPKIENRKDALAVFDKECAEARAALAGVSDAGHDEGLDAAGRRPDHFHHAAHRVYSRNGDESSDPSSRAAHGLLSAARHSGAGLYGPSADEGQPTIRQGLAAHPGASRILPVGGSHRRALDSELASGASRRHLGLCGLGLSTTPAPASRIMVFRRHAMETPVILSAVRTPVGKFQGGLAGFSAPELGGKVVAEATRRAGLDAKQIDEAILGNVVQAGLGQNPARQAALKGGCDPRVAAHDHQQSLRLRPESGCAGRASRAARRIRNRRRRRHGVHVQLPVSAAASAHRLSPRRWQARSTP